MESKVYNQEGKEVGKVTLPESVFGLPWNADLVHQVVVSMQSNARGSIAHAKTRAEVRGGGKKPWKQKGTGRARHGSTRSPIWVGGGASHGPLKDRNFTKKINKKMRAKALYTVLSKKFRDGEVLFVDALEFKVPKTSDAKKAIESLGSIKGFTDLRNKRKNAAVISLGQKSEHAMKSFRNFNNIEIDETRNLNPVELLTYKYVVFAHPDNSIKVLSERLK